MIAQDQMPIKKPVQPAEWAWIVQRQQTDGKAESIWKFGFIAPDGAEVRVTFHQVADQDMNKAPQPKDPPPPQEAQSHGKPDDAASAPPDNGMKESIFSQAERSEARHQTLNEDLGFNAQDQSTGPSEPSSPPMDPPTAQGGSDAGFRPPGTPNPDDTNGSMFYITFFSNRNPEWFMKWDTSLDHEDSLTVWVTIAHGMIDFLRKAKPTNLILDDLGNGKLKMVLRSVAMDLVATNPEYELEQTAKHVYRTFFQVKRKGTNSAFNVNIKGNSNIEGETPTPMPHDPNQGPVMPAPPPAPSDNDKTQDPTMPQPGSSNSPDATPGDAPPAPFPSADGVPIQQVGMPDIKKTAPANRGLTVEMGRDYSVAVRDKDGNPIDRYRGKNPADILRWIQSKGYAGSKMKLIDREQMGPVAEDTYQIQGKCIRVHNDEALPTNQVVLMSYTINPASVRKDGEDIIFEFATERDMEFKKTLVELAYQQTRDLTRI